MNKAVVLGAGGGLGGALVRRLAADGGQTEVVALSRRRPPDLPAGVSWLYADLDDETSLAAAAQASARDGPPDLVLVATGRLHGHGLSPEKSWKALEAEALVAAFRANAVGPALAAKHFLPLLPRDRRAVFAALSGPVGSIGDNQLGGWYGYRAAKAALNQFIRTLGVELARQKPLAICAALHPGTVDTALSAPFQARTPAEKLFAPDLAAERLLAVVDSLTPAQSGGFFAWDGSTIPW
ncbi:MAG TPA: SDR family NAD(P)-dependent oxidoreductase [Phenylobacterium sp.]|nr:SDR family NAD(P)-dependent oxidoreductase [Phenylobacterium sp.]